MTNHWRAAISASVLAFGCSAFNPPEPKTARVDLGAQQDEIKVTVKRIERSKKSKRQKPAHVGSRLAPRKVGDYFVHRFSGSFRQGPLTLIERVVAEHDDRLVVDYTLEDGAIDKTLRVELDRETERPVKVSEISDLGESEVPLAAYQAMLEETVFIPDINDALLAESEQTCLVGPKELDCEVKRYRVFVGDQEAKLTVTRSAELPGRDISGEITGVDGSVIYRAELLDSGNTPQAEDSVAAK